MDKFTSPLNSIRIASPCRANWDEMYGNDRKRFCAACKLSVYNLSEMTQAEAENFLMNSEGRLCLRIYRRKDGTVLTKDCPVGWKSLKYRVWQTATASFAFMMAFFTGLFTFNQSLLIEKHKSGLPKIETQPPVNHAYKVEISESVPQPFMGGPEVGGASSDDVFEYTKKRGSRKKK